MGPNAREQLALRKGRQEPDENKAIDSNCKSLLPCIVLLIVCDCDSNLINRLFLCDVIIGHDPHSGLLPSPVRH